MATRTENAENVQKQHSMGSGRVASAKEWRQRAQASHKARADMCDGVRRDAVPCVKVASIIEFNAIKTNLKEQQTIKHMNVNEHKKKRGELVVHKTFVVCVRV